MKGSVMSETSARTKGVTTVTKSFCHMCPYACGIDVSVKEGKVVNVRPMKEHFARQVCVKGAAWKEMLYHPDRLAYPLKRVDGSFQRISWDQALEEIGSKLLKIKEKYGPESLACYLGTSYALVDGEAVSKRFCDVYGSPNITDTLVLCLGATWVTGQLMFGTILMPNFSSSRCIILFGYNPSASYPVAEKAIKKAQKEGAKLIIVDPRTVPLARKADIHARIRPGTDGALALGMANVIIQEKLYDADFVQKWTVGFEQFAQRATEYPPQRAADITWVPAETIVEMARMYAANKPATISPGVGAEQNTNGVDNIRAIMSLVALTGNYDIKGGNRPQPYLEFPRLNASDRAIRAPVFGGQQYPILGQYLQRPHWSFTAEGIDPGKPYPIKAIMALGSNPALTMPDTRKVMESFKKLELLVSVDTFMRETGQLAHYVLPQATYLERSELIVQLAVPLVSYQNKAVEPYGESRSLTDIMIDLAKKMGYGKHFNWANQDELYDYLLKGANLNAAKVQATPQGIFYTPKVYQGYLTQGFGTPSGKIELSSSILKQAGYDPVPAYREQEESPVSRPDLAKDYPIVLTTGARLLAYTHTNHRNLPSLNKREPFPKVEIHPDTAKKYAVKDSDNVFVETLRGKIKLKACVTEDIVPGVAQITHGWGEASANLLTSTTLRDPILGYPTFRAILCKITKA